MQLGPFVFSSGEVIPCLIAGLEPYEHSAIYCLPDELASAIIDVDVMFLLNRRFEFGNGSSLTGAYAATTFGLGVIDITDRSDPVLIDYISTTIELSDMQHGVWVEDDVAYIADNGEQKFIIVSVCEG